MFGVCCRIVELSAVLWSCEYKTKRVLLLSCGEQSNPIVCVS